MIQEHKYKDEVWVDIDRGTPEEIHELMNKYSIHPFVAKELTSLTRKPRIEFHDEYLYCILHFPAFKHTHGEESNQEIDFIIGRNILITARYDTVDSIHNFSKNLEVNEILEKNHSGNSGHAIFINMLHGLYGGIFDELEYIEDSIDDITKQIFLGKERKMVVSISEMTRTLLYFKHSIDLHRDVLESLSHNGQEIFGVKFAKEMEAIMFEYQKINSILRSNLEVLKELRDTNNSILSTKQNEIMKQLTVMGFVILPLNLIAWIFAMRTEGMPIVNNPNAFWIVIGIMVTSAIITTTYAKHKNWL